MAAACNFCNDFAEAERQLRQNVDGRSLLDGRRRERLLAEYWQDQADALGIRDWVGPRTGEGYA